jgi:hypothetical protein
MRKILIIILLLFAGVSVKSQTLEAGLFGGTSYYLGDLNPAYHFLQPKPAYGILARYNAGTRWAFKLNGFRGKVFGSDAVSNTNQKRQLSFESVIWDFSLVAEFNFFDYFTGSKKDNWSPYIFGGLGYFTFNPKADDVELSTLGTEGQNVGFNGRKPYNKWSIAIPFGIGFKFSLNSRISAALEWGVRKTFTDYIDDVSTTYYLDGSQINPGNTAEALSDPTQLHQPYQERGNPQTEDWYSFAGLTVTYKFNFFGNRKCPDQRR